MLLVLFYALGFCTCFPLCCYFRRKMKRSMEDSEYLFNSRSKLFNMFYEKCNENEKLREMVQDDSLRLLKNLTIQNLLLFCLCMKENDVDKMSLAYNRLFFWGIPKKILDDGEMVNQFIADLMDEKIIVLFGEKPFICSFRNNGSSIEKLEEILKTVRE